METYLLSSLKLHPLSFISNFFIIISPEVPSMHNQFHSTPFHLSFTVSFANKESAESVFTNNPIRSIVRGHYIRFTNTIMRFYSVSIISAGIQQNHLFQVQQRTCRPLFRIVSESRPPVRHQKTFDFIRQYVSFVRSQMLNSFHGAL